MPMDGKSSSYVRSSRDLRGDLAPGFVLLEHELHQQAVFFDRPRALDQPRLEHLVPSLQALGVVSSGHALCDRLKHTQTHTLSVGGWLLSASWAATYHPVALTELSDSLAERRILRR